MQYDAITNLRFPDWQCSEDLVGSRLCLHQPIAIQPFNRHPSSLERSDLWQNSDFEAAHVEEDVGIVLIKVWEKKKF